MSILKEPITDRSSSIRILFPLSLIHIFAYLDDILSDLTSGDGHYELVKLKDAAYQERLDIQRAYWERLKAEVAVARQRGYENTQIVAMSETYFKMADETVSAAEHYSEKIAMKIRTIAVAYTHL